LKIETAHQTIAADPALLSAYGVLAWSHNFCHLYRWGPEPGRALDAAWSAVEHMLDIDALDCRTLTQCGVTRVMRGEQERGIADLRRALEVNPNSAIALIFLAFAEATAGLREDAEAHALLALRLSPRDLHIGGAPLALVFGSRVLGGGALGRTGNPISTGGANPPRPDDRLLRPGRRSTAGGTGAGCA
jgi:tetratricopeptide (TPR) repeat protein